VSELPDFLVDFLEKWHARDAAGCAAFYAEDGVMVDPMTDNKPIQGHEAIRRYYADMWEDTPDVRLDGLHAAFDEHGMCWMWRFSGTGAHGPFEAVGASYLRLNEARLIVWDHAVWDLSLAS
jgi:ketosteroid isomerase-like protein